MWGGVERKRRSLPASRGGTPCLVGRQHSLAGVDVQRAVADLLVLLLLLVLVLLVILVLLGDGLARQGPSGAHHAASTCRANTNRVMRNRFLDFLQPLKGYSGQIPAAVAS